MATAVTPFLKAVATPISDRSINPQDGFADRRVNAYEAFGSAIAGTLVAVAMVENTKVRMPGLLYSVTSVQRARRTFEESMSSAVRSIEPVYLFGSTDTQKAAVELAHAMADRLIAAGQDPLPHDQRLSEPSPLGMLPVARTLRSSRRTSQGSRRKALEPCWRAGAVPGDGQEEHEAERALLFDALHVVLSYYRRRGVLTPSGTVSHPMVRAETGGSTLSGPTVVAGLDRGLGFPYPSG